MNSNSRRTQKHPAQPTQTAKMSTSFQQDQHRQAAVRPHNPHQSPRQRETAQAQKPHSQSRSQPRSTVKRQDTQPPARRNQSGLSDNLRSQTPLQRQMKKNSTPSEPGTVRRTATQHFRIKNEGSRRRKRDKRKTNRSFFKKVLVFGVICYLILLPLVITTANLLLKTSVKASANDFRYQLGEGKSTLWRKTYSYFRIYRDGVYYIDMDSLAEYCKLTTTGDGKHLRYVVRESGESVEFVIGESIAYINGVSERTGGNAFLYEGKLHIPLEFAKRCFINLDISLDTERNRITIVRDTDQNGNYLSLDFPYKLPDATENINFAELEVEIQEQIIKQNQPVLPEEGVTEPIQ